MRQFQGAVAYLDLLGIGPLTRGKVKLQDPDFLAFDLPAAPESERHHRLAGHLLITFRRSLRHAKKLHGNVNVAQLSDAAFLWSRDPLHLVEAVRATMWYLILEGVLCRGGMAYGGIVEPERVDRTIGAFVLGQAATGAVDVERSGKGSRIFCDSALTTALSKKRHRNPVNWGPHGRDAEFVRVANSLDGTVVEEFRWFIHDSTVRQADETSERNVVELLAHLRYSPRFRWNSSSPEGLQHLGVSVEAVSQTTQFWGEGLSEAQSADSFIRHPPNLRSFEIVREHISLRRAAIAAHTKRKSVE